MGLGAGGPGSGRKLPQAQVGGTLIAAALVVLAIGLAWMNTGGGDSTDDVGTVTQRAAASEDDQPAEIPPSQPAVPVSFGRSGEFIRPAPDKARIVDPETGNDVVVPLPAGATVVDGQVVPAGGSTSTTLPGNTGSTASGGGSTATTSGGSPTTQPPTTAPPTTEPPTTEPPTTAPPTTEPPTTEAPTTTPPTGSTGAVDGLLGGVLGLLT